MANGSYGRKDRLIKEERHDVYKEKGKLTEPTLCPECGALFVNGRWSWKKTEEKANKVLCPACKRIADKYPAGYIEIRGAYFKDHSDDILNLIRNIEKQEKEEHPMERIMAIADEKDHTLVTTTGIHLARRIGEALSRSHQGNLSINYSEDENRIRGFWER